jgi:diadenosine tetraphosphate (Ap4A) HIT family hydrolase
MAAIDPRLLEDCQVLGHFPLCHLLLMKDANYPWLILVPDREGIRELYQLDEADQQQLMRESMRVSRLLAELFQPDKLNLAALGNVVPQLHIHHVVRYRHDAAWPAPVWGRVPPRPYSDDQLDDLRTRLTTALIAAGQFQRC